MGSHIGYSEELLSEIREADRQIEFGHYVRHEDMKAWLLSWGTESEIPPPNCVCGENHDAHQELR